MPTFKKAQCAYCREEKLPACRKEHPEWFSEEPDIDIDVESAGLWRLLQAKALENYENVHAWIGKNTLTVPCVVFDSSENEAFCIEHLKVVLKELRNYQNGKEMS